MAFFTNNCSNNNYTYILRLCLLCTNAFILLRTRFIYVKTLCPKWGAVTGVGTGACDYFWISFSVGVSLSVCRISDGVDNLWWLRSCWRACEGIAAGDTIWDAYVESDWRSYFNMGISINNSFILIHSLHNFYVSYLLIEFYFR